jgi:hypothetical protein
MVTRSQHPQLPGVADAGIESRCPKRKRIRRPNRRNAPPPTITLFRWATQRDEGRQRYARVLLLNDCRDADGNPRVALLLPGERVPRVYPNLAAARAAERQTEAQR